ncbi:MAG: CopG family ribbon-helix-helix protein, partial [Thermoplasmata archaeon]
APLNHPITMLVVSVSLPAQQLREFDSVVEEMGYSSRSDALREAIHRFMQDHQWIHSAAHGRHFLMSVLYDEDRKDAVSDVLHRFRPAIHNSAHSHFDGRCVDQLVLLSEGNTAEELAKDLASLRDVRVCNCLV